MPWQMKINGVWMPFDNTRFLQEGEMAAYRRSPRRILKAESRKLTKTQLKAQERAELLERTNPVIKADIHYIATCTTCTRKIDLILRQRQDGAKDDTWMKAGDNCGLVYKQVDNRPTYMQRSAIPHGPGPSDWRKRMESGKWNIEPLDVPGRPFDIYQRGTVLLLTENKPIPKAVYCLNCKSRTAVNKFEKTAI